MIRRTQAPKTPSSRLPPRRRRRPVMPMVRRAARWSALLALAGLAYGGFALSRSPDRDTLLAEAADRVVAATASLGMVVEDIEVEGRETTDASIIMTALATRRGAPILAVDLWQAKAELEKLPWVRSAAIERRLPRTLHVRLTERRPLALWQHAGKQHLIDRQGEVIPAADLSRFARLPLVVGDNAATRAAALVEMLQSEPALAARVTAAVRVDNRRWNLRIDDFDRGAAARGEPRGCLGAAGCVRTAQQLAQTRRAAGRHAVARPTGRAGQRAPNSLARRERSRAGKAAPSRKEHVKHIVAKHRPAPAQNGMNLGRQGLQRRCDLGASDAASGTGAAARQHRRGNRHRHDQESAALSRASRTSRAFSASVSR